MGQASNVAPVDREGLATRDPGVATRVRGTAITLQRMGPQAWAEAVPAPWGSEKPGAVSSADLGRLQGAVAGEWLTLDLGLGWELAGVVLHVQADAERWAAGLAGDGWIAHWAGRGGGHWEASVWYEGATVVSLLSGGPDGAIELETLPRSEVLCSLPLPESLQVQAGESLEEEAGEALSIPILRSRPGAQTVLYLDSAGSTVTGTSWNSYFTRGAPIVAKPAFFTAEKMERIWRMVAEDFAPFEINVTTDPQDFADAPRARRLRVILTQSHEWYGPLFSALGVAILDSFGSNRDDPVWVFTSWLDDTTIGNVASHEAGHAFGLRHHGHFDAEYHEGTGHWAPIMGFPTKPFSVWARGDYVGATRPEQDDLQILTQPVRGLVYRQDDHAPDPASGTALDWAPAAPGVLEALAAGTIGHSGDRDGFTFDVSVSAVVEINDVPRPGTDNLRHRVKLVGPGGNVLAELRRAVGTAQPARAGALLEPGRYGLRIDADPDSTPTATGTSDYGSLGDYQLLLRKHHGKVPAQLEAVPAAMNFTVTQMTQSLRLRNTGDFGARYRAITLDPPVTWLTLLFNPNNLGGVNPQSLSGSYSLKANDLVAPGLYSTTVRIEYDNGTGSIDLVEVPVTFNSTTPLRSLRWHQNPVYAVQPSGATVSVHMVVGGQVESIPGSFTFDSTVVKAVTANAYGLVWVQLQSNLPAGPLETAMHFHPTVELAEPPPPLTLKLHVLEPEEKYLYPVAPQLGPATGREMTAPHPVKATLELRCANATFPHLVYLRSESELAWFGSPYVVMTKQDFAVDLLMSGMSTAGTYLIPVTLWMDGVEPRTFDIEVTLRGNHPPEVVVPEVPWVVYRRPGNEYSAEHFLPLLRRDTGGDLDAVLVGPQGVEHYWSPKSLMSSTERVRVSFRFAEELPIGVIESEMRFRYVGRPYPPVSVPLKFDQLPLGSTLSAPLAGQTSVPVAVSHLTQAEGWALVLAEVHLEAGEPLDLDLQLPDSRSLSVWRGPLDEEAIRGEDVVFTVGGQGIALPAGRQARFKQVREDPAGLPPVHVDQLASATGEALRRPLGNGQAILRMRRPEGRVGPLAAHYRLDQLGVGQRFEPANSVVRVRAPAGSEAPVSWMLRPMLPSGIPESTLWTMLQPPAGFTPWAWTGAAEGTTPTLGGTLKVTREPGLGTLSIPWNLAGRAYSRFETQLRVRALPPGVVARTTAISGTFQLTASQINSSMGVPSGIDSSAGVEVDLHDLESPELGGLKIELRAPSGQWVTLLEDGPTGAWARGDLTFAASGEDPPAWATGRWGHDRIWRASADAAGTPGPESLAGLAGIDPAGWWLLRISRLGAAADYRHRFAGWSLHFLRPSPYHAWAYERGLGGAEAHELAPGMPNLVAWFLGWDGLGARPEFRCEPQASGDGRYRTVLTFSARPQDGMQVTPEIWDSASSSWITWLGTQWQEQPGADPALRNIQIIGPWEDEIAQQRMVRLRLNLE